MTERDTVNHWLAALPATPAVALDGDGICALQQDKDVLVMVEVPEGSPLCLLYSPVMPEPEAAFLQEWLASAMALNLYGRPLGGCWLAYDRGNAVLVLCYNLPVDRTSSHEFANALQNLVASLKAARVALTPDEETLDAFRDDMAMSGVAP